jgi:predicted amidophosphoribosyltransferase
MNDEVLVSTKKCPFCQQWSEWQQQPSDRCTHCGKLLDPRAHDDAQRQAAAQHQRSSIKLLEIRPEDSGIRRFLKTIGRGGQLLFIAVMGFFIWLATLAAA